MQEKIHFVSERKRNREARMRGRFVPQRDFSNVSERIAFLLEDARGAKKSSLSKTLVSSPKRSLRIRACLENNNAGVQGVPKTAAST